MNVSGAKQGISMDSIKQRIEALRQQMQRRGLAAYIIPSTDPHQSEYVPTYWQRREWISGFTGSAGDVVITQQHAGLWTDGRYHVQAAEQLKGSSIKLFAVGKTKVPTIGNWLATVANKGDVVGIDPKLLSRPFEVRLLAAFKQKGVKLKGISQNLVDVIRPSIPSTAANLITRHPKKYTGETSASKLTRLRKLMTEANVDAHLVVALDCDRLAV